MGPWNFKWTLVYVKCYMYCNEGAGLIDVGFWGMLCCVCLVKSNAGTHSVRDCGLGFERASNILIWKLK